ncbi:hypothetical protein C8J57DRAFT_1475828 [Mycena rebaudengoi]|nr:hypothetical protein C8J57DRAFT_1475828 [Mycena rebaudengoi]
MVHLLYHVESPFLALQPVNTNSHWSIAKRAGRQRELAAKIRSREKGTGTGLYRWNSTGALADVVNVHESDFRRRRRDLLSYRERMLGSKEYYRCLEIARKIDMSQGNNIYPWRSTGNC